MFRRFNEAVKTKLREKNKSLRKLCREAGIDASFLSKVLKNKRNPPSDERILQKMAVSLGVNPIELIIYTGKIPEKYYDFFCSEGFIERLNTGGKPAVNKHAATEKKCIPVVEIRPDRPKRSEMSEELL
jgi:transcriptional regulator with XRE-family HTH domain